MNTGCRSTVHYAAKTPAYTEAPFSPFQTTTTAIGPALHLPALLQILKVPLDSLGRRWEVRAGEVVASLSPCTSRELCATFRASPDFAYVVVPHAG